MQAKSFVADITAALTPLADPERALSMKAYLLHQFDFLGLPAPIRRAAVKDFVNAKQSDKGVVLNSADLLWTYPLREYRYTAIDLLRRHAKLFDTSDLPFFKKLLQTDSWWETVDGLSAVIGAILRAENTKGKSSAELMNAWIKDEDFWVRRSAMLHQLGWREQTDQSLLAEYALTLAHEQESSFERAIGWALRDYARAEPDWVLSFTAQHEDRFANLTLREARKHL